MNEEKDEKISKLTARNQLLDSNNRILAQKLKDKDKEIKTINNLYLKEKAKLSEIYRVVSSSKINEENYTKMIDWIKETINARWYYRAFN